MYTHEISKIDRKVGSQGETEHGKYQLIVYGYRGVPVFRKEYASERQARNGTIDFMHNGPNLGPTNTPAYTEAGKGDDTKEYIGGVSAQHYLGYDE